jgi:hypothetical protein
MNLNDEALLAVSTRQDKPALKTAQTVARVALRAEAKAARERLREENKLITKNLKLAIINSDADVAQLFQQTRESHLENGKLSQVIARKDIGLRLMQ